MLSVSKFTFNAAERTLTVILNNDCPLDLQSFIRDLHRLDIRISPKAVVYLSTDAFIINYLHYYADAVSALASITKLIDSINEM